MLLGDVPYPAFCPIARSPVGRIADSKAPHAVRIACGAKPARKETIRVTQQRFDLLLRHVVDIARRRRRRRAENADVITPTPLFFDDVGVGRQIRVAGLEFGAAALGRYEHVAVRSLREDFHLEIPGEWRQVVGGGD